MWFEWWYGNDMYGVVVINYRILIVMRIYDEYNKLEVI